MMDQPTWIGRTLSGRYKIEAMLGQGGMSAVYKASDPNLKRVVAIKLIHPHLSTDPAFIQRFESEAAAVASLRHPNIVQVYDFNNDNGVYYMVLEFIPGETLQDRMQRLAADNRQLSLNDILKFSGNISDAVGYAHQRGMVHRDIKPANIMLDVHGQAILMDFGIVKILGGDSHTSTGAIVGTARYMPPEIIRGEVADVRSDIYSLGVTIFEMLSGRPPFMSDSAMTLMMMHLNDPVPDIRGFRSDAHPQIVEILQKCLEKNRDDRYQSAADLSGDIKRGLAYLGGQPTYVQLKKDSGVTDQPRAEVEATPPPTPNPAPAQPAFTSPDVASPVPRKASSSKLPWVIGAGFFIMVCVGVLFLIGNLLFNNTPVSELPLDVTQTTAPVVIAENTQTEIPAVTETPTQTATPPPTATPEGPYVIITEIRVENSIYAVDYEVHNFGDTPYHVHMFFNTVAPEQAGSPGAGPWKLTWSTYGDPPFTQYGIANRPPDATQMCALVANSNHTIILGSGNCVNLPD